MEQITVSFLQNRMVSILTENERLSEYQRETRSYKDEYFIYFPMRCTGMKTRIAKIVAVEKHRNPQLRIGIKTTTGDGNPPELADILFDMIDKFVEEMNGAPKPNL